MAKQTHELITNRNGTISLREIASGEVMHSVVGPREEATLLYIEQSRLRERLTQGSAPLVLFDVGLGAGSNALAALQVARELSRPIIVHSFETDPSGFELAIENHESFPFFEGFLEASHTLLSNRCWKGDDGRIDWQLHEGHFFETMAEGPRPDLIFFDLYSPNVVPELWTVERFKKIFDHCTGGRTALYTYSASTRVRIALLLAGFFVGYGRSTGAKIETTVAATHLEDLDRPLDLRWIKRMERSHAMVPYYWPNNDNESRVEEVRAMVKAHPQFQT